MAKFSNISSLNQKYVNIIADFLNKAKPSLIAAFVNFYGTNHQKYIEYIIDNIKYIYVISEESLTFYKDYAFKERAIFTYYLAYLNYIKHQVKLLPLKERENYLYNAYVVGASFPLEDVPYYLIVDDLPTLGPAFFNAYNFDQIDKIICLPIISINLYLIIHEINHALTTEALAFLPDEEISNNPFRDTIVDELINELMTYDIYQEYQKLGGKDIFGLPMFNYCNAYTNGLSLVKSFYDTFKSLIKESLITRNDALIRKQLGPEVLSEYCKLVEKLFFENISDPSAKLEEEHHLDELIETMTNNYLSSFEPDYEAWFTEMLQNGTRVRRLSKN